MKEFGEATNWLVANWDEDGNITVDFIDKETGKPVYSELPPFGSTVQPEEEPKLPEADKERTIKDPILNVIESEYARLPKGAPLPSPMQAGHNWLSDLDRGNLR